MNKLALALAAAVVFAVIYNMERGPAPPDPRPVRAAAAAGPAVTLSGADVIPMALVVEGGEVRLTPDIKIPSPVGTFGVHVSPRRVRVLYLKLGTQTRAYEVNGRVRLFIPNSLGGNTTFEWDGDSGVITIPDPADLRFPADLP